MSSDIEIIKHYVEHLQSQNKAMLAMLKEFEWGQPIIRDVMIKIKDNKEFQEIQKWFYDRGEDLKTELVPEGFFYWDKTPDALCNICYCYKSSGHKNDCRIKQLIERCEDE